MKKLLSKAVKGFTLIELMIVVAIIGILAAIAIPKFADLITKSREAGVKGNLGTVRSGVSIYYSDTEGLYPATGAGFVTSMTAGGKYLQELPDIRIPKQNTSANKNIGHVAQGINATPSATADRTTADTGNWYYDSLTGNFGVECTHEDTKSLRWSTY